MTIKNKKWNQWVSSRLSQYGKTDEIQLSVLIAYLKITHNIPAHLIKKDNYILLDGMDYSVLLISECITDQQMAECGYRPVVRRPDIILLDEKNPDKIKLIIELDGSCHHTTPGAKKTSNRNADYQYANIPLIVIDILDLKLIKKSWFDDLDEKLLKINSIDNS